MLYKILEIWGSHIGVVEILILRNISPYDWVNFFPKYKGWWCLHLQGYSGSSWTDDSVILEYDVASLGSLFPTIRDNVMSPSKDRNVNFWKFVWGHYVVSTGRELITRWRGVIFKKNGFLSYTAAKTWKRVFLYLLISKVKALRSFGTAEITHQTTQNRSFL